jgi:superfamily II DNA/RNA helicase
MEHIDTEKHEQTIGQVLGHHPEKNYESFDEMPLFTDNEDMNGPNMKLLRGILSYGFEEPTIIQQQAIVPIYQGKNVIAQAPSGTGKTGTFVIGSLSRMNSQLNAVQVVMISHTRELASQTHYVLSKIGSELLKEKDIVLGVGQFIPLGQNIEDIRRGAKIVVGTPGRVRQLIEKLGKSCFSHTKILVLDEADDLISEKNSSRYEKDEKTVTDSVKDIFGTLLEYNPQLQICIFSATFQHMSLSRARGLCCNAEPATDEWYQSPLCPVEVLVEPEKLTLEGIIQYVYYLDTEVSHSHNDREVIQEKIKFIDVLNQQKSIPCCIIYVNSKSTAEILDENLHRKGIPCACIHGGLSAEERIDYVQQFRRGEYRVLITTNLLARGFDVQSVALVVNFDMPNIIGPQGRVDENKIADYLHRIGRSGRHGRKGTAINLAHGRDRDAIAVIESHYRTKINEFPDDLSVLQWSLS